MLYRLLLLLAFLLLHIIYWRPYAVFTDEKASVFLSNGIPTDNFAKAEGFLAEKYASITAEEIARGNTSPEVYRLVIRDGGNGQLYYQIAHFVSRFFGPIFGVFNSLKLLSCLFSFVMVVVFYRFARKHSSEISALIASILLAALSVRFNVFVRNYSMSNMFVALFFVQSYDFYHALRQDKPMTLFRQLLFLLTCIALPFTHFFNVIFLGIVSIPACFHFLMGKNRSGLLRILMPIGISLMLFAGYYIGLNEAGRSYQYLINQYWKTGAGMYGLGSNYWLAPFTLKFAVIENEELLLRIFGLDLRDSFRTARLMWLLPLLLLPFGIIFSMLRKKMAPAESGNIKAAPTFVVLSILVFLGFMNFIVVVSGHATALNSQWYSSPLFLLVAFLLLVAIERLKHGLPRILLMTYCCIVLLNSVYGGIGLVNRDVPTERINSLLEKIEIQAKL